ncbi:MAG: site-2 protease family protein [Candidatus Hydrogenedentota bacterium]
MTFTFVFVFGAWVFSLCVHEFSHAIVAYQGGDYTVKDKGYLSFNPLKFMHPGLSIGLPLFFLLIGGIGLPGGCVYIERHLLRSRGWDCLVSLAGPLSNLGLAILLSLPFSLGFVEFTTENPLWNAIAFLVMLQVFAVILNMLPVPGLDGFGALSAWMDELLRQKIYRYSNMAFIGLFVLIFYVDGFNKLLWGSVMFVTRILGVPPEMAWAGYEEFRLF